MEYRVDGLLPDGRWDFGHPLTAAVTFGGLPRRCVEHLLEHRHRHWSDVAPMVLAR